MKLLLLHPLPLDGSIFSDETSRLVGECYSPTLYRRGSDIEAWAQAALNTVGLDPLVVVGNSIGGSVAIEIARLAPAQVKALVLVGVKPGHRPDPDYRDRALRCLQHDGLRTAWERYWLPLFGPSAPDAIRERAWRTVSEVGVAAVAAGVLAFHARPDREAFLQSWPGPVSIVGRRARHRPAARTRPRRTPAERPAPLGRRLRSLHPLEQPGALHAIIAEALAGASGDEPTCP